MQWTSDTILEFIGYYAEEPIIWNSSQFGHKNREELNNAWTRIQQKLGNKYSIIELKKKRNSLMATYRTCKRKVKECNKLCSEADETYKPNWFAYDKMFSFLNYRDQSESKIKIEPTSSDEDEENDEIEGDFSSEYTSDNIKIEDNSFDYIPEKTAPISEETALITTFQMKQIKEEPIDIIPSPKMSGPNEEVDDFNHVSQNNTKIDKNTNNNATASSSSNCTIKAPSRRKRKTSEKFLTNKLNEANSILKSMAQRNSRPKDICDLYGELTAAKLRCFDEQTREITMHQIDNYIFETKMNQNIMTNNYHQECFEQNLNTSNSNFPEETSSLTKLEKEDLSESQTQGFVITQIESQTQ